MKRIYFLLGTALLLCCLVNFNLAQAQTDAAASWPLTADVEGVATSSEGISAADETLNNLEVPDYDGTNGSQRIRILGNEWPVEQTDTLTGTYVQFVVSPDAGNTFNVNSISYDISSAGTGKMSARAFYSTDPSFQTATEIANGSGAADWNVPRDSEQSPAVMTNVEAANLDVTVGAGESLYVRIYPWMNNASATDGRSGKYIYLQNVVVGGTVTAAGSTPGVVALQDSVHWMLGIAGSESVAVADAGLEATEETVSGLFIDANMHRGAQRLRPEAGWQPGITGPMGNTYIEFAASPAANYAWDVDSLSLNLGGRNNGNFRAAVYYSTNGFTDSTEIFTSENLFLNDDEKHSVVIQTANGEDLVLAAGETITIRIYPWIHEGTNVETGHWFLIQDVILAGTVTSTLAECDPTIERPFHRIVGGDWTESPDVVLEAGQGVQFGPHPTSGYTWTWTGPNGWTFEGREPLVENFTADMAGEYVATFTNGDCVGTITYNVTVNGGGSTGPVNVAYVTADKQMAEGASDPILAMLQADENLNVTVHRVAGDVANLDLSGADVIVAQEGFGSGDAIWKPDGPLALSTLPAPTVYNKTYALRDGRAVVTGGGTSAELAGLSITIPAENQAMDLFNGITFTDNAFQVFNETAADDASEGTKSFNFTSGLTLSADNTLLATAPEITEPATTVFLNFIPAGTTIGDQVVAADLVMMGMNFGAISRGGNNVTAEGLTLWRNAVYMLAGLPVPETPVGDGGTDPDPDPVNPADVNIVFVAKPLAEGAPETNDDEQIAWLRERGFNVETYYNATLSTAPQADIDMLNAADLVIIGRSGSSGDFGGDQKAAWNALTVPVILNSNWMARDSRLNWFVQAEGSPVHVDEVGTLISAMIEAPTDPVFSNVTPDANNILPWTVTPEDFLYATSPGNATVLAVTADTDPAGAILFARFAANQEFYTGSVDMPAAERVYFVFGNDHAKDETGADIINFFPLTEQAQTVYFDEIMRLAALSVDGGGDTSTNAELADLMIDGATVTDFAAGTNTYDVVLPAAGDIAITAATADPNATVSVEGADENGMVSIPAEGRAVVVTVTAEDGTTTMTYTINFTVDSGVPADDATLADLTMNGTTITGFDPATQTYTVNLPAGTTTIDLGAVTTNPNATVTGGGNIALEEGENNVEIVVTPVEGEPVTYIITFVVAPTGIADLASQGVKIFPNPVVAGSELNLDNAAELVTVKVYNSQGVLVRSITSDNNAVISIGVSDLADGFYLLKAVKKDTSVLTGKFVKK